MKKLLIALAVLAPVAAFAQENLKVVQKGRRFLPAEITMKRGDKMTVTNEDEFIHQIFVPGEFDTDEKRPGENIEETFSRSGTFEVRCHIHPKMKLVVHVN